ncbi:amino acid kinase family protein [Croceibacterium soli]|uniref:amino acid kinase family protein n=1 Tax=Croceibacterium soli TaxID=1739690 RepID=UPI00136E816A|nr:homoserine dehydrogenase [Croceibacterium soli]
MLRLLEDTTPAGADRRASGSNRPLRVLKFGGSVLRSGHDLQRVAGEIYRQTRDGAAVIAVVSAFEGETDELLQLCETAGGGDRTGVPDIVSLGEEKTARLLRLACLRIGIRAMLLEPEALAIRTEGDALAGRPVGLSDDIAAVARSHSVVIVPGYVGLDREGRRTLLGRGGTDFSAIFIAGETGAALRLYKDVDGVYDHDPAVDPASLQRYAEVSWRDCLTIARPLLQPRAVEYAAARAVSIEVGAIGSSDPTVVAGRSRPPVRPASAAPLRIGLAGFGTVGQALQVRLAGETGFAIAAILVADAGKARAVAPVCEPTADPARFLESGFDILVDATGGCEPGTALCSRHLARGGDVVSANKAAIAAGFGALHGLAGERGGRLEYSACVGGSAPMVELARRARGRGQVVAIEGVLNGTVNLVLNELALGRSFDEALELARRAGYAEADPSADLSGRDAAAKLRILAAEIWGEAALAAPIAVQALDRALAARIGASGETWIQLASFEGAGPAPAGAIRFVPAGLAGIRPPAAEWNVLHVRLAGGEELSASGRGAGGAATAEALLADLYAIAALRRSGGPAAQEPVGALRQEQPLRADSGVSRVL